MTGEFCSRDGRVPAFFKVTLKVIILNVSIQPEDGGRQSGGSRGKFYGPHLCPRLCLTRLQGSLGKVLQQCAPEGGEMGV